MVPWHFQRYQTDLEKNLSHSFAVKFLSSRNYIATDMQPPATLQYVYSPNRTVVLFPDDSNKPP
ncbi:MAG: hypothetical protein DMF69_08815 [Acidobacteria bacterium]|nr:MAG: hypothetical protein DMF69_08815 [Acidobacteriota bacterium]